MKLQEYLLRLGSRRAISRDLSNIALYSMILGRRTKDIPSPKDMPLARRFVSRLLSSKARWLLPGTLLNLLGRRHLT
ncbi:MAG: hypothetical protein QW290_07855 [Sulfolobales archaeon]